MKYIKRLAFPTAAAVLCVYILFAPPFHGIADNGDFARVLYPCGLKASQLHSYFYTVDTEYIKGFSYIGHMITYPLALLGLYPAPPHIYPTLAAMILTALADTFNIKIYAGIVCAWYIFIWTLLLERIKNPAVKFFMSAAVLFVFFDGSYIQMFASFYGEGMILIAAPTAVLCFLRFSEKTTASNLLLFAFSSNLLINSKIQCVLWYPFAVWAVYYIGKKSAKFSDKKYRAVSIAAAAVLLWNAAGGYFINGAAMKEGAAYNAAMCGILEISADPAEDIIKLGLPEECIDDIGRDAYMNSADYAVNPEDIDINMGRIAAFYIKNPAYLAKGLKITAESLFDTNIHMGTLEDEYAEDYRFNPWGRLRRGLREIMPIPLILAAAAAALCVIKRKRASARIMLMLMGFAVIEFMLPFAGNGVCDIQKQLMPVNIVWDMSLLFLVRELLGLVCGDKRVDQLVE